MRRVRRPIDKEELFKALNFEQLSSVVVLAACLGYEKNKRTAFANTGETIRWETFSEDYQNMLKIIALAASQDTAILSTDNDNGDAMLTIIEEYANGGLEILKEKIIDEEKKGLHRLDKFFELIIE